MCLMLCLNKQTKNWFNRTHCNLFTLLFSASNVFIKKYFWLQLFPSHVINAVTNIILYILDFSLWTFRSINVAKIGFNVQCEVNILKWNFIFILWLSSWHRIIYLENHSFRYHNFNTWSIKTLVHCKDIHSSKSHFIDQSNLNEYPSRLYMEIGNLNLKSVWKCKEPK